MLRLVTPIVALALAWPLNVAAHADAQARWAAQPSSGVPLYENLGNHHYPISTKVAQAQRYFDQGLRLYYGFNHRRRSARSRTAEARRGVRDVPVGHCA